ncbi:MAG: 50S ribosomal protein L35Ae [Candidatus Thorarchaeota archaeon]|nr:MAG: 50S ribosomal protein L35Ae [Candidatus Thorarchaeota archaeon]
MSESKVLKGHRGVVVSYRRGKHLQHTNQVILIFDEIGSRNEAAVLIGRKIKWTSDVGKEFLGKVLAVHGNSGAVRAKFRTNLPGQAIGTPVHIV